MTAPDNPSSKAASSEDGVLRLGFSPCPNDTFMFHALVHSPRWQSYVRVELGDIEELNRRAGSDDPLEITKLSLPALAAGLERYSVLPAGAALGRGVGPLVVRRPDGPSALGELAGRRVAIPGARTTANLLLRSFAPPFDAVEMRFDRVLEAVERGEVDAGLIIHESRFTYASHGLEQIADLGDVWERETGLPLPLGVICARRDVPAGLVMAFADALRSSIESAFADPSASAEYVHQHAQEMDPAVCRQHIALYVNEWSVDLGAEGRRAIVEMIERGVAVGLLPESAREFASGGGLFAATE
jgi:1,4-dihydroxy-6-naphthoate synthase